MYNNISKKIRIVRTTKGYTQKEFAELLGVKQNVIRDIELAKQNITVALLSKIIEKFQIDPRYFFSSNFSDIYSDETKENNYFKIPYIDITDIPDSVNTNSKSYTDFLTLSKKIANALNISGCNDLYALICPTDAVAPAIKKNDIIIINNNCKQINDGNFYIIKYFSEILIRKIIITEKYIFKALDSLYTDINLDRDKLNDVNILGEIKCVIKNI